MKLTRKFYYTRKGEKKINNYLLYIPVKIAKEININENVELKLYTQNDKIIIEKK